MYVHTCIPKAPISAKPFITSGGTVSNWSFLAASFTSCEQQWPLYAICANEELNRLSYSTDTSTQARKTHNRVSVSHTKNWHSFLTTGEWRPLLKKHLHSQNKELLQLM